MSLATKIEARKKGDFVRRFASDERGNIAILFGLMTTVLFLFVGAAVDFSRRNAIHAEMVESLDAASLALRRYQVANPDKTPDELKSFGEKFFKENFSFEDYLQPGWTANFDLSREGEIRACVSGNLDTFVIRAANIDYFDISDCVGITTEGSGRIELSLVLDVSGSMNSTLGSTTRIGALRDAVTEMTNVLFRGDETSDLVKLGVVPFNYFVNPGGTSAWASNPSWGDTNAEAFYHGDRFFHVSSSGEIIFDTKVNHYELFNSISGSSWKGCVEARPYPLDELDTPPGQAVDTATLTAAITALSPSDEPNADVRAAFSNAPAINSRMTMAEIGAVANSRWVPHFYPDGPDCNSSTCKYSPGSNEFNYYWYSPAFAYHDETNFAYNGKAIDDPDDVTGIEEDDYHSYIDDFQYAYSNQGTDFARYFSINWEIVQALFYGAGTETYWDNIRDMMGKWTATSFDTDLYIGRQAYVGWYNGSTYVGKYDQTASIDEDLSDGSMTGPNRFCGPPILPMTNTKSDITNYMTNQIIAYGGTNIPNGLVWGWRVLSDAEPFTEAVDPDDPNFDDWRKAVVLMTDGRNTTTPTYVSSGDAAPVYTHWKSSLSAYGFALEERLGDGVNVGDENTSSFAKGATFNSDEMVEHMDAKLLRICRRMREEGILVYAILFGNYDEATSDEVELFKACATEDADPYFHIAPTADKLEEVFGDIAANLVNLHISE